MLVICFLFTWGEAGCGRWDTNPHDVAIEGFQVPCVYQLRHVRFGRQIRYLARFPAKWNELGQDNAPRPIVERVS